MRKGFFLLLVWALTIGGLHAKSTDRAELKVMSYNIRHAYVEATDTGVKHWDVRKPASVAMIRDKQPDIIGFQEMKEAQKQYVIDELNEYQAVNQSEGNTKFIMYRKDRFEELEWGNFWLSETPDVPSKGWGSVSIRATLWVKLRDKITGKELYFFDTHLDVKSYEARIKGAAMNVERMKKICGKKKLQFIVGDMNTQNEDDLTAFETWMKNGRKEAANTDNRPTYNGFGKSKKPTRLDHIYVRNGNPEKYEVVDGKEYGVPYISDHYPVMLTINY